MNTKISALKAVAGSNSVALTWAISGSGHNAIEVKWRPTGSGVTWTAAPRVQLATTATSYTVTGLTNGDEYAFQVVPAQYAAGSETASATPTAPGPPPPPPPASGVALFHRCADAYSGCDYNSATVTADAPRRSFLSAQGTGLAGVIAYRTANPLLGTLLYKDSIWADSSNSLPGSALDNPCGVGYAQAEAGGWLLGVSSSLDSNMKLCDPGNAAYQAAWAANAITALKSNPVWTGLFIDDCNMDVFNAASRPAKYTTPAGWQAATRAFIAAVAPLVRAAGYAVIVNIGGSATASRQALLYDWLGLVDGYMDEGWLRNQVDPLQPLAGLSGSWPVQLQNAEWCEANDKLLLAELPATTSDVAGIRYGLATLLLVAGGHCSFDISASDAPGGNYTEAFWGPDFDTARALGAPSGAASVLAGGVYRRIFANGIVLANPTTASQTITLGGSFSGCGLMDVSSVTLLATSGLVLLGP